MIAALASMAAGGLRSQDKSIQQFEERVRRDPRDGFSYAILGDLYLRSARQSGAVDAYSKAESALRQVLKLLPGDPGAAAGLASALYGQHRFAEALEVAQAAYQSDPRFLQALVTVADAQLSLGRYRDAEKTYQDLARQTSDPPVLARIAYLEFLKGDTKQALTLMLRAAEQRRATDEATESAAWYELRLGDLRLGAGHLDEARPHYQEALDTAAGYDRAMAEAGIGNLQAAGGDIEQAVASYERAIRLHPQPSLLAVLGDLYQRLGKPAEAQRQYDAVRLIAQSTPLNGSVYMREMSLFFSDHDVELARALELARQDWTARQDIYGADALAWALYKNGRFREAADAIKEATRLGTQDARLYYHAGLIWRALEDSSQARESLEKALAINPQFSVLQADHARQVLAEINNPAPPSGWLLIGVVLAMSVVFAARWAVTRKPALSKSRPGI